MVRLISMLQVSIRMTMRGIMGCSCGGGIVGRRKETSGGSWGLDKRCHWGARRFSARPRFCEGHGTASTANPVVSVCKAVGELVSETLSRNILLESRRVVDGTRKQLTNNALKPRDQSFTTCPNLRHGKCTVERREDYWCAAQ